MKPLAFALLLLAGCTPPGPPQSGSHPVVAGTITEQQSGTTVLLQAVSAVDDHVVWVSGHHATWVRTVDGGRTWTSGAMTGPDSTLEFRDVEAVSATTAYLLAAGPGDSSRIYKTTNAGRSWQLQFINRDPAAFYDCFGFWDATHGIAVSDAVRGKMLVIRTDDGEHWSLVAGDGMPPALPKEGSPAAGGTCLTVGDRTRAWFGTEPHARVYRSSDRGSHWAVATTPIVSGEATGVATLAFRDAQHGMALGGRLLKPEDRSDSAAAVTSDGGATWTLVSRPTFSGAVYGDAVVPGLPGYVVAAGPKGLDVTGNDGRSWTNLSGSAYWAVTCSLPHACWAVGPRGRITRVGFGPEAGSPHPAPPSATSADITEADLRRRLFAIADDSMLGRESGSLGAFKTADYVAAEFRRLGLEPAGENGSWFQILPLWLAAVDTRSRIEAGATSLQVGRDFVPASVFAPAVSLDGAQAIYGGLTRDSTTWISAEQAAGKLVILDLPAGSPLRGIALGGRWSQARAIALTILESIGPENVARLRVGRPVPDTTRARITPVVWITHPVAAALLGADPAALQPGASGLTLRGWFDIGRTPVPYPARNVVAILRGSDPALRGEYVSLTAHNDHVGFDHFPVDHDSLRAFNRVIRPMGADSPQRTPTDEEWTRIRQILDSLRRVNQPRLDSIRNGADDDGSGTVALLEIAEAMSRSGVRPRRSILFVNHTGEEAGLLGSRWFTDHPTVPLDSIVAEIDEDMTGRGRNDDLPRGAAGAPANPTYLEVVGAKRISKEFGDTVEAANARQPLPFVFDYTYDQPGHPLQYYCRADHYSYARYGIPSLALSRGEHLDYHQVTDEAQYIDYPDLARVTRMVYSAALALANMSHRPAADVPKPADPHSNCRQ